MSWPGGPHACVPEFTGSDRFGRVADRGRDPIEELTRLRREVGGRHAGRVPRRPGEPPVVLRLSPRRCEEPHCVDLRRDVRRHLIDRHHRPAPGRLARPGAVREWAVRRLEERACGLDRRGAGRCEHERVLQVVVEVLPPDRDRLAWNGVSAEIAVDLLRPVAHVRGHVRPERGVRKPVLKRVLVRGQVTRSLPEADDEDGTARRAASRHPRTARAGTPGRSPARSRRRAEPRSSAR